LENEIIIKKTLFGGFNRREVMEYINNLQIEINKTEEEVADFEDVKLKADSLESEIADKNSEIERLNQIISETERELETKASSDSLIKESMSYADKYIESARALAKSITDKTTERVDAAKTEIEDLMRGLGNISQSVAELYRSLTDLKKEYEEICSQYDSNVEVQTKKINEKNEVLRAQPIKKCVIKLSEQSKRNEASSAAKGKNEEIQNSIPDNDMITRMLEAEKKYKSFLK
jgi:chromosome segregation protein